MALARTIDLADETAMKAVGGAVIGASTLLAELLLQWLVQSSHLQYFIIAGSLAGGGLWGSSVSKEEKSAREAVLTGFVLGIRDSVYSSRDF